jgi:hypothetical protein
MIRLERRPGKGDAAIGNAPAWLMHLDHNEIVDVPDSLKRPRAHLYLSHNRIRRIGPARDACQPESALCYAGSGF